MPIQLEWFTAAITIAALIGAITLRTKTEGRIQITLNDAIIAVIAAMLVLVVSGNIDKMGIGKEGFTFEFKKAAERKIEGQVKEITPLPISALQEATKGATSDIPQLIRRRVQALDFVLGAHHYFPNAVERHFSELTPLDFFRFIVIITPEKKLFGMFNARVLYNALKYDPRHTFEDFTEWVNRGSEADRKKIAEITGFVSLQDAVKIDAKRIDVLAKMEKEHRDWLPVVSADNELKGIVEQSQLSASILVDVTGQLR
jgi:CBS domain-containing protein